MGTRLKVHSPSGKDLRKGDRSVRDTHTRHQSRRLTTMTTTTMTMLPGHRRGRVMVRMMSHLANLSDCLNMACTMCIAHCK